MQFEYDPDKSQSNLEKHGIDFEAAQLISEDPDFIEVRAKTSDEPRYLVIGKIEGKHWSAVVTYRDEATRLISVRRSRQMEVAIYES